MFDEERWQGWKKRDKWSPYKLRNITNTPEEVFAEWLDDVDSHGTSILGPNTGRLKEEDFIRKSLAELKDVSIIGGDPQTQRPSRVIVDITHLKPEGFQPTKTVLTTLAHLILRCPCKECKHTRQYECYLNDCLCCTWECT